MDTSDTGVAVRYESAHWLWPPTRARRPSTATILAWFHDWMSVVIVATDTSISPPAGPILATNCSRKASGPTPVVYE